MTKKKILILIFTLLVINKNICSEIKPFIKKMTWIYPTSFALINLQTFLQKNAITKTVLLQNSKSSMTISLLIALSTQYNEYRIKKFFRLPNQLHDHEPKVFD